VCRATPYRLGMISSTSSTPTPAEAFSYFATEARGRSAIYTHLAEAAVDDPLMTSVMLEAPPSQRRANLLFAAVHDLVLEQRQGNALAAWYPSVGGTRAPDADLTSRFRTVIVDNEPRIVAALRTRTTQTNEVGRTAVLWPAVQQLASSWGGPVALIELGASAGLLLHMDRLENASRGDGPTRTSIDIRRRLGVDLAPRDATDEQDARWLRACVWPDNLDRLRRLDAAIGIAARYDDVELLPGDIAHALPEVLDSIPSPVLPVVFHSAAVTYLPEPARHRLYDHLEQAGTQRPLIWLSFEGARIEPLEHLDVEGARPTGSFTVAAATWTQGHREDRLLGFADPHGEWVHWHPSLASSKE
jgi:hypothetical protein